MIAIIAVADQVREMSREAIRQLKQVGIERTIMLTGDNWATARAIAQEVGVDEVRAEFLPQDKVEAIRELQKAYGRIGMVGAGVSGMAHLVAGDPRGYGSYPVGNRQRDAVAANSA